MPIHRRNVKSHFKRTFHPVFRHLRRQLVQTFVYEVLREGEDHFIDWLYDQLKEFMKIQRQSGYETDSELEDCEEDQIYVDETGFPLPPELELDDREEEDEHTDTSSLNASHFENRSLLNAEEAERKGQKMEERRNILSSSSSSSDDSDSDTYFSVCDDSNDENENEKSEGESDKESSSASASGTGKKQNKKEMRSIDSSEPDNSEVASSSSRHVSDGNHSKSVDRDSKNVSLPDISPIKSLNGSPSRPPRNHRTISFSNPTDDSSASANDLEPKKVMEGSGSGNSTQYSLLTAQKLNERGGQFTEDKVERVLGKQPMNLEPLEEISASIEDYD